MFISFRALNRMQYPVTLTLPSFFPYVLAKYFDEPQPAVSVTGSQSASNALENVSDEVFRAPKAAAPLCVCCGGRLCSGNFVERFALFL
jgi:hypothetical protein